MGKSVLAVVVLSALLSVVHPPAQSSGTVRVDGVELRYVRMGQGPSLLVIGSSVSYPKAFSRALADHFDVTYTNSRHFVPTYQPNERQLAALTLDTFAEDVEAIRANLGLSRVVVVGHSAHAQIALRYALRHPDRVTQVVLICGVPYSASEFEQAAAQFWERDASPERKLMWAHGREGLEQRLAGTAPSRRFAVRQHANGPRYWADPSFDAAALLEGLETGPALDRLFVLVPPRAEVRAALRGLKPEVLLALGRYDYAIPYTVWEELVSGLGNVKVRLFDKSGHYPHVEQPEAFNAWLVENVARSR
jgi:proline iminopeptidase